MVDGVLELNGRLISLILKKCSRPELNVFPPDTKWVLAINGQGAKPGNGLAISHCGEYWLKVEDDYVVGGIDGDMKQVKRMPLREFKNKFLYTKFSERFSGRVESGKQFHLNFGSRFEFILDPMPEGWQIFVKEFGRDENLARLTPPFHFMPNPRQFIFSPEVGKTIAGPDSRKARIDENIDAVRKFGRGELDIKKFKLAPGKDGCPKIEWLEFSVPLDGGY